MRIRTLQHSDHQAWDDYVLNHPQGTFFHLTGWKRVIEKSFGHRSFYLIAERDSSQALQDRPKVSKTITGILPLFSIKSLLFGKSLVSVPFATYGGILASDQNTENALLEKAKEITERHNLDYLEIRNENGGLADLPTKDLYYSFKKELFGSEDQNLKAIPRKSRRMVRVGISENLDAVHGGKALLDEFYDLFAFNYRSYGTPVFSKKYLFNLLNEFGEASSILIIRKDGRPLSGVLSFFFKDQVIPYYSGAYPEAKNYAANDFLYWSLMCIAMNRGCRVFDFGRSKKDTGPYRFKKHWGFEPKLLHYQFYLNGIDKLPEINPNNPKYHRRIELWKKLPLNITKVLGPHIVKYIP